MDFPEGYQRALTDSRLKLKFPNLIHGKNFEFTSLKTDDYNCVAWASEIDDEWIEYPYDDYQNFDDSVHKYINHFLQLGFTKTDKQQHEEGILKIAIYTDQQQNFLHVARSLPNKRWTSKIGDWEDIEHNTLDVLSGEFYGSPQIIMQKAII